MTTRFVRVIIYYIHKSLTEYRLAEVESFIDHSRSGMKAIMDEFSARFDRTTAGWPKDRINDYVDQIYDDIAMFRDGSPQLLRHAQCMIIYGTFENAIVNLCCHNPS